MVHGNLSDQSLEAGAVVGRFAAESLVFIDDDDAVPGPTEGNRVFDQGILAFPGFPMLQYLLWARLSDINDGQ